LGSLLGSNEIVRPNGATPCVPTTAAHATCTLDSAGNYVALVTDHAGSGTGSYAFSVQPLDAPVGCPAVLYGGAPGAGTIGSAGQLACHTFSGTAGERVRVHVVARSGTLKQTAELVRPNGTTVCGSTANLTCSLNATGTYTVLVFDGLGTGTGGYAVAIQR